MKLIKVLFITITLVLAAGCSMDMNNRSADDTSGSGQSESIQAKQQDIINTGSEEELASKSNYGYIIVKSETELSPEFFAFYGAQLKDTISVGTGYYYYVSKEEGIADLLAALKASGKVLFCEPDITLEPDSACYEPKYYNDPYLVSSQYAAYVTGLKEAWETFGIGSNEVYAVVVDTGINMQHEEFAGVIHKGYSYFERDDNNFYTWVGPGNDPVEMDYSNWDNNYRETHGTRVAGVVAARGNNSAGITGVCPENVKLIMYKIIATNPDRSSVPGSGSLWTTFSTIPHIVEWKTENKISQTIPVNMSLGDEYGSQFEIDMINHGLENDVVIIASSGNNGRNYIHYPASYPGVIAVGATRGDDLKAYFSNSGDYLSVSAPGLQITTASADGNSSYTSTSGTSFSAPFVTGLAAYLLTFNPELKPNQIKQLLEDNADDLGAWGFDRDFGYGRVNVYNTVRALLEGDSLNRPKYSEHALHIKVTNDSVPVTNLNVYLYDEDGRYVIMSTTGQDGTAFFNLLKTGVYTAKANYLGRLGKAENIDFTNPAGDVVQNIGFTVENRWFIQSLVNEGDNSETTDTGLILYDSTGTKLKECDNGLKDTLEYALEPGQVYYISAVALPGFEGHYGFSVSRTKQVFAPGSDPLAEGNDQYEPNNTPDGALEIEADTIYNCFAAGGDTDFFKFTVPAE